MMRGIINYNYKWYNLFLLLLMKSRVNKTYALLTFLIGPFVRTTHLSLLLEKKKESIIHLIYNQITKLYLQSNSKNIPIS